MDWLSMLDMTLKQLQSPPNIPTWVLMLLCIALLLLLVSIYAAGVEAGERRVRQEWQQARLEASRVKGTWTGKEWR